MSAQGLSFFIAFLHLTAASPCAVRARNLLSHRETMSDGTSDARRIDIALGHGFLALFLLSHGGWRFYAGLQFSSGFWPAHQATLSWFVLALFSAVGACGVLLWGLRMMRPDSDADRAAANRWFLSIVAASMLGLGIAS